MEQNEILILSLVGALTPITILIIKACYKSKCSNVSICCGAIKIKREVQIETELGNSSEKEKDKSHKKNSYPSEQQSDSVV